MVASTSELTFKLSVWVGMSEETGQLESIKRKINEWGERKKKEKRAGIELATNVWETSILPLN